MFELGFTELVVIAIVAILVMGPEQLPRVLYKAGKWARQLSYTRFALEKQFEAFMDKEDQREQRRDTGRRAERSDSEPQQQSDGPPDRTA